MTWRWCCICLVLVAPWFAAPTQAQLSNPDTIVWRLKNPFRYFKSAEATERHIKAYRGLTPDQRANPILNVEQKLAKDSDGWGWAGAVFHNVVDESCWYSNTANKAEAGHPDCGAYVRPASHTVLVSAPAITGKCVWTSGTQTVTADDCSKPRELSIPFPTGAEVTLSISAKTTARRQIIVEDILVIGLGDSFGSGEGNPDRPVSFKQRRSMDYGGSQFPRDEFAGYPLRDGVPRGADDNHPAFIAKGAGWVHRNCHRSLYSQQLRTALHLAVSDAWLHRSVTYLGFACTGATILDLFNRHQGRDEPHISSDPAHSSRAMALSQLSTLSHALCKPGTARIDESTNYNAFNGRDELLELGGREIKLFRCDEKDRLRPIDVLLLSVGGNDVGFSGLVANAALDPAYLGLPRMFNEDPTISPTRAAEYLARLPGRYTALAHAFKTAFGVIEPSRVLLTAYPKLIDADEANACRNGNAGMDVTGAWKFSGPIINHTEQFVEQKFTPAMKTAAAEQGWTFIAEHRAKAFDGHGLCAAEKVANNGAVANPRFPRYHIATGPGRWRPYTPDRFRPYAPTARYFRTPNDAFLAAHHHGQEATIARGGRLLQLTSWAAYSGAFHPNALGHAAIADAVVPEVERLLAARPAPVR